MALPIELAIALLEDEIQALGKPREGTSQWFLLRGMSHGLSLLKAMLAKGFHSDPLAAETFRKSLRVEIMQATSSDSLGPTS